MIKRYLSLKADMRLDRLKPVKLNERVSFIFILMEKRNKTIAKKSKKSRNDKSKT